MKIKIGTLSLWNGERLHENIIPFLQKEDFDIVFLQEVFNSSDSSYEPRYRALDILKEKLKYPFSAYAPAFKAVYGKTRADRGNAILSKFSLTPINNHFLVSAYREIQNEINLGNWSDVPRTLQHVSAEIDSKSVDLLNMHGIWDFHGNDNSLRLKMADTVISSIKNKEYVILAGDFNTWPNTQSIQKIDKHLKSIFAGELSCTFNMKHKGPGYENSIVDMIFVSPNIQVGTHYMPDVDVSDHMPLVAELTIR